jgi:hypothetical protein
VGGQVIRLRQHLSQKPTSLDYLGGQKWLHGGATAHQAVTKFAITAETLAVREKNERVFPTDEFASHLEYRPVRVYGAFLVEHLDGYLGRIQDDERLPKHRDRANVAWKGQSEMPGIEWRT